ncbi:hypothetical protein N7462_004988 [Penicillium macrosclerotiorum]|uniref:uncharacterized protein n=1 Tax=Penicillium macrosclerotiorum TaxID=303699 RepID=UPI0025476B99|nr:uncharacterized protein N7462_004988 [Penicillium macrosclerotiorum]KAJ5690596.1 hypothetical protein N7462_004988 [Penicillium macrosclerotiorum]
MSIGDFLADDSLGSWADEMEDMPVPAVPSGPSFGDRRPPPMSGMGFNGGFEPRETRGGYAVREPLALPTEPPFTAHVGNLSFEATADDISDLFAGCGVTNVRIVEDKLTKAPKGFGYVEFETVDGLQKALDLSGTTLQGRTIRTSVAEPPKESSRADFPLAATWMLPPMLGASAVVAATTLKVMESSVTSVTGSAKALFPPPAGPPREGGRPRNNDGPGSSGFRRSSPGWGEGRSQDGSRPPRPERTPTAAEMDNQWRSKMRPDQPAAPKESSSPTSPVAPATRPKLNLAKRTVSDAVSSPASSGGDSKASPFGAARPIDTATREREVEEKRQLAIRQKKEADDKAKAEKPEKTEKSEKSEKPKNTKEPSKEHKPGMDSNKDAIEPPRGGGNFEILRRAGGDESGMAADKEPEETAASTAATEEPAKESATNGSWRAAETADDNDGWSTVDTTKKRGRRGGRF